MFAVCGLSSVNCWENETRETAFGKLWNPALKHGSFALKSAQTVNFLQQWLIPRASVPSCFPERSGCPDTKRFPKSVPRRHWGAFIKCLLWLDTLLNNHKPNINHFNLKPTSAIEMLEYQINVILSWYYYSYCSFSRHLSKVTSSKWGVWEKHICLFPMRKIEKVKIKNPNHIINLCLSVWRHVHRWVSGET